MDNATENLNFATGAANTLISNTPLTLIPDDDFWNGRSIGRLAAALEMIELAGLDYDGDFSDPAYRSFDYRRYSLRQMVTDLSERADEYRAGDHKAREINP